MPTDSWATGMVELEAGPFPTWDPYAGACAIGMMELFQNREKVLSHDVSAADSHQRSFTPILPNFHNDNPGKDLFVQVTYYSDIGPVMEFETWNVWAYDGLVVAPVLDGYLPQPPD